MKKYNKILEAIDKGIQLALDDYDDNVQSIPKRGAVYQDKSLTKEYQQIMKDFVDLGLPSGTLWAKYNLGVNVVTYRSPREKPVYCAWGETKTKRIFDSKHYKYFKLDDDHVWQPTKYCYWDGLTELLPEDDIVVQTYQNKYCHIPTIEQAEELIQYTECKNINGIQWILTSKINGNHITFDKTPIYEDKSKTFDIDIKAAVWTSSVSEKQSGEKCAYGIAFYNNRFQLKPKPFGFWKYKGLQIRPVCNLN